MSRTIHIICALKQKYMECHKVKILRDKDFLFKSLLISSIWRNCQNRTQSTRTIPSTKEVLRSISVKIVGKIKFTFIKVFIPVCLFLSLFLSPSHYLSLSPFFFYIFFCICFFVSRSTYMYLYHS